jgi:3-dehydroquinate synthase
MHQLKSNDACIEVGSIEKSSFARAIRNYSKIVVLIDENTEVLLPKIKPLFKEKSFDIIKIKSGEKEKNLTTCETIWAKLLELNIDRNGLLVNLGGGVITDIGGFTASTYKRGIDFINIPSTLLSMVDASVGGKTGVNFGGFKNNIGLFNEPRYVFCDRSMLETLPQRELISGIGEVLKHALIADKSYWDALVSIAIDKWDWTSIILQSINIKNNIVLNDPFEKSERKKLNFGHTIGHAIESNFLNNEKPILHGEAVAIGLICESYISYLKKLIREEELIKIPEVVLSLFQLPKIKLEHNQLLKLMLQDKKNENNTINFTLLNGIGDSVINQTASSEEIIMSLDYYQTLI